MDITRPSVLESANSIGAVPPADVANPPAMSCHLSQSEYSRPDPPNVFDVSIVEMAGIFTGNTTKSSAAGTGPLQLLDLPIDILKEIFKEVTPKPPLTDLDPLADISDRSRIQMT